MTTAFHHQMTLMPQITQLSTRINEHDPQLFKEICTALRHQASHRNLGSILTEQCSNMNGKAAWPFSADFTNAVVLMSPTEAERWLIYITNRLEGRQCFPTIGPTLGFFEAGIELDKCEGEFDVNIRLLAKLIVCARNPHFGESEGDNELAIPEFDLYSGRLSNAIKRFVRCQKHCASRLTTIRQAFLPEMPCDEELSWFGKLLLDQINFAYFGSLTTHGRSNLIIKSA